MFGSNRSMKEPCANCDEYSHGRADAEEEIKKQLRESFPLSASYSQNKLKFAQNYIREMRKWATENLGVQIYE